MREHTPMIPSNGALAVASVAHAFSPPETSSY